MRIPIMRQLAALCLTSCLMGLTLTACGPGDCSYLNVHSGELHAKSWQLIDATSSTPIVVQAPGWQMWLGGTGAGDGEHYSLSFGPPVDADGGPPSEGAWSFRCEYVAKTSLVGSVSQSIDEFCGGGIHPYNATIEVFHAGAWNTYGLSRAGGTVHVSSTSPPDQVGATQVTMELPSVKLPSTDGKSAIIVAFSGLSATVTRDETHQTCSPSGGGGGLGTWHGWMPGGG